MSWQSGVPCSIPCKRFTYPILFPNREKTANFPDLPPNSTQEPEETMSFECPFQGSSSAAGSLDTSRPLRRHPCPQQEASSGHGLLCPGHSSPCPGLQGTGRATGLSCGQGPATLTNGSAWCLLPPPTPSPHPLNEALQEAETQTGR